MFVPAVRLDLERSHPGICSHLLSPEPHACWASLPAKCLGSQAWEKVKAARAKGTGGDRHPGWTLLSKRKMRKGLLKSL